MTRKRQDSNLAQFAQFQAALPFQRKGYILGAPRPNDMGVDFYVCEPSDGQPFVAVEVKWARQESVQQFRHLWKAVRQSTVRSDSWLLVVVVGTGSPMFYAWLHLAPSTSTPTTAHAVDFKRFTAESVDRILRQARLNLHGNTPSPTSSK